MLKSYRVWDPTTKKYTEDIINQDGTTQNRDRLMVEEYCHKRDCCFNYIFEHDVVVDKNTKEILGIVAFNYDQSQWSLRTLYGYVPFPEYSFESIKIIGNSHSEETNIKEFMDKIIISEDIEMFVELPENYNKDTILNKEQLKRIKDIFNIKEDITNIKTLEETINFVYKHYNFEENDPFDIEDGDSNEEELDELEEVLEELCKDFDSEMHKED